MAERVHLRLEQTLPELEEMGRVGLFSPEEIRKIKKKREAFEYKLRRNLKRKEDFLKYIEYEMNLLSLISKRRDRLLCESKKKEIDIKIAKRISKLFNKWYDNINVLHTQMLKVHSKVPNLWVMAAKYEFEESKSPENARKLLQRGVLINSKAKILWREYFRMELMYTDLIRKRREVLQLQKMEDPDLEEDDVVLNGKIPNVVFDKAIEEIDDDVEFALSFIQICLEFDFTAKHIEHIFEKVLEKFPDKEETLDALAKQPLLHIEDKIKKGKEQGIKKKVTLSRINEEIFSKYEEAVKTLSTEKMWNLYIDFVLNLIKSSKENRRSLLQDKVVKIMERAASYEQLSAIYYSEWIELLFERGDEGEGLSISLEAARKFNTVDLWFKTLTFHIQLLHPTKQIYKYLLEALNTVPEKDSVILWKLGVEWLSALDPEKLIEFFETGIKKPKEISVPLKEMYLEATAIQSGIEATRKLYKKFKKLGPISHHIVKKMILIENGQMNSSIDLLRQYYEDGIQEFGATNIDIWLDYMKLELEHKDGNSANYATVLWRAKKMLQPEYVGDFQTRLTEFMSGSHSCNDIEIEA
ncbi:U3 small nucleolar RNA-associated protein 6 homolog isoform X2 [Parasteatoda tepidariorum]|uniref:U3 small nucleolar RNA-associated protein 6 homolog isoform X2 n=1 Tax=Parasteatoda tepidariorum TaxID=114398 RepID=UPI001C725569|nr:U3 small nucleolar RNA-associated protein 6 homolog isoform X2 [Parasteatoda tepidariorum]